MKGRNVGTIREGGSYKQNLTSAKDLTSAKNLTMKLLEGIYSTYILCGNTQLPDKCINSCS